jgi:signal transduction histidine kinase/DNA-binding response OmpR family regulator/HAMP domain-containing protein
MSSSPRRTFLSRFGLRRLSTWLLVAFVVLTIVPVAILTWFSSQRETASQEEDVFNLLGVHADAAVIAMNNWASTVTGTITFDLEHPDYQPMMLNLVSGAPVTEVSADRDAFALHAQDIARTTDFDFVALTDARGLVQGSSDSDTLNIDLSTEEWFQAVMRNPDEVVLVGPVLDPISKQESILVAGALRDPSSNQVVGVLMGRTGITPVREVVINALPQGVLGTTGDYFLVRPGQQYVIQPRFELEEQLATDEIVDVALEGNSDKGFWTDYRGQLVIGVYRWIEPLNMVLVVKQDQTEAFSGVQASTTENLLVGGIIALVALLLGLFVSSRVTRPLTALSDTAEQLSRGDLNINAPSTNIVEIQQVSNSLNLMTAQLKELLGTQEDTIKARTRQLQITAQIGRAIAAETDLERLLDVTISRIRDQLGHYHAQVFLLDDLRQYAVLRASTGDAGQALLERGHKLPVGSRSVIGQVTSLGEPVLAGDTLQAEYWMPNPLLPATRAELSVPIRVGDTIMGALDVQSVEPDAFDEETIAALQTIADQLAVALRNAQLFEEKEGLISASVQLTQMLTRESWDTFLTDTRMGQGDLGFSYDLSNVRATGGDGGNGHSEGGISMPIALRGEVIGELETWLPENQNISEDERQLVSDVLDRVALALENARLFEQTQVSLQETNRLYQASRRISAADSMPNLADALVEMAAIDTIDRAILLLLDNPDDPVEDRWTEIVGSWMRDPNDPVMARFSHGARMHTSQPPLTTIEEVEAAGNVFADLEHARIQEEVREANMALGVKSLAIFPLITSRRTIGWLVLHATRQPNAFSEGAIRFYRTLADQAATALESLRLLEQTQIRARRLQATNEVSRAASSILNPDILLPMVVDRISDAFGYYHVQVFLVDDLGENAILRASTGEVGQKLLSRSHLLKVGSQSVIGQVTASGEPVIVRDTATDPTHKPNELLPETRSEMAIPLKTGDRVIGALDVQSSQANAFDLEAQQILQSLTGEMAVTLENAQLFREIQERVAELSTINLVSQAVSRANTLDEVYEVVSTELTRTFGARNGYLAVYDPERQLIHLPLFIEQGERLQVPSQPLGAGITSHVISTRQVLMINENAAEEGRKLGARVVGNMSKSLLVVPLLLGEEVVGVISIQDHDREHAYTETHVRQLSTLSAYIAVKIRNAELLQQTEQRAGELGFLFSVTRAAVGTSDLDAALSSVADILINEVPNAESAIIYLASANGEKLEPHAAVGWAREIALRGPIDWGQGMVGYGATVAQPLIIDDAQNDSRFKPMDTRVRGAMLVPLMTPSGLTGILAVESSQPSAFDEQAVQLLEAASSTLTAIIQNARLLEEITQANEQLQELDRLKSQFLAAMSHELRTPLNSIIGFSRVMLKGIDGPLNDLQSQDLNTIYNSGQHLLGLINDILDLSKIEAKMMEIQPEYMSMNEIVDGVMSTAKGLTKDKPIELYKEIQHDLPMVWADPQRLRQVLLNLVSNAAKFTKEGTIVVRANRLEYDPQTGRPPRVQVDVQDSGIGISQDKLARVFEAFQQADGSTTREYGGTGLGLPISKNFVELHGGDMWVESAEGQGSTFSFWVPLHPQTAEGTEVLHRTAGDSRPLVLAIDDEQGVIDLYTRYLEKEGYAVMGLSHANDVIHHVRELQPAAVIMDINLPGKDGWLAINDLKQTYDTQQVPIIISSIDVDRERAESVGISEILIKPIIEDDLIGAMRRALESSPRIMHSVLVVDAYPDHAEYIRTSLEATGYYTVKVYGVGYEALGAVQESAPEALVIDVDLPDMDGYQLVFSMRNHPDTRHIPVVILTAREMSPDDLAKLGPWDITAYMSKYDYDGVRLADKVAEVMTKAPTSR